MTMRMRWRKKEFHDEEDNTMDKYEENEEQESRVPWKDCQKETKTVGGGYTKRAVHKCMRSALIMSSIILKMSR